ncbi:hypothetical protein FDF74_04655 [Clostridium niameyense]|uniref:Uncharacterized protein n=1 Tax=Clostridium niameyense TaxID=1622073 RepID=A0A6M0R8G4_9CLOT|nr:hypothetical protein [Clostridium niameyense]NEZ46506.1 hypothetical protein [Clostridium niameyense]
MTVNQFKEDTITNDLSFFYRDKEYFIFLLNDGYHVGQYDDESNEKVFGKYKDIDKNFNDMIENWFIEDKLLKNIINEIKINY